MLGKGSRGVAGSGCTAGDNALPCVLLVRNSQSWAASSTNHRSTKGKTNVGVRRGGPHKRNRALGGDRVVQTGQRIHRVQVQCLACWEASRILLAGLAAHDLRARDRRAFFA